MSILSKCAVLFATATLTFGCGGDSDQIRPSAASTSISPSLFPGTFASVPQSPPPGQSRPGQAFDLFIESPDNKEKVPITVFEPSTIVGGEKYPLLIHSHGWGGARVNASNKNFFKTFLDKGYGVVTFDQRGWAEAGGTVRAMDPDADGPNMLAVLDWAESNLDWLAYGIGPNGRNSDNLVLGSFGESYGGMYQMLMYSIDPKKRLDAMQITAAPNNLLQSIYPGGISKSIMRNVLLATSSSGRVDPYLRGLFLSSVLNKEQEEFLLYHSHAYFCETLSIKSNGGIDTKPRFGHRDRYPVNVVIAQGVRDPLFDLTQGIKNYECFKKAGGDVRLFSAQYGHNVTPVAPDLGNFLYFPLYTQGASFPLPVGGVSLPLIGNQTDPRCGTANILSTEMQASFFDEHLKGIPNAAASIPKNPCLSIASGDSVLVESIKSRSAGGLTERSIAKTVVPAGIPIDTPIAIDLGVVGSDETTVLGGIPHVELLINSVLANVEDPTLFLGLGQSRLGIPGVWDLMNNQLTPIRGTGQISTELVAVTGRLKKGERLALLVFGLHNQFAESVFESTLPKPVTIEGKVFIPLLKQGEFENFN